MDAKTRAVWLALALGPCPTRRALSQVKEPLEELRAWWNHREAFGEWLPARDLDELLASLDRQLRRLARRDARALLATEAGYPAELSQWPDAPAMLFCWGKLPAMPLVAVVGSRAARAAGMNASRELCAELTRAGCCVLSGGAIGIDGAAHEGALSAGGQSVAILGSGLDHLYPQRHTGLFARIAKQGAVLSPFAPWTPPRRWQFPRRNEVMARLARLVVVIEAGATSGALITADFARAARRQVLARPGSPGVERLLRGGAGVIESAEDVLAALDGKPPKRFAALPEEPDAAAALAELRRRAGELSVAELAAALSWSVSRTAVALMRLHLASFVQLSGGGRYSAIGSAADGEPSAIVP